MPLISQEGFPLFVNGNESMDRLLAVMDRMMGDQSDFAEEIRVDPYGEYRIIKINLKEKND